MSYRSMTALTPNSAGVDEKIAPTGRQYGSCRVWSRGGRDCAACIRTGILTRNSRHENDEHLAVGRGEAHDTFARLNAHFLEDMRRLAHLMVQLVVRDAARLDRLLGVARLGVALHGRDHCVLGLAERRLVSEQEVLRDAGVSLRSRSLPAVLSTAMCTASRDRAAAHPHHSAPSPTPKVSRQRRLT